MELPFEKHVKAGVNEVMTLSNIVNILNIAQQIYAEFKSDNALPALEAAYKAVAAEKGNTKLLSLLTSLKTEAASLFSHL